MPRIRTIKPQFWTDETLAELPRDVRLLFLGLISAMADDEGRLKGNPKLVRAAVFPLDDDITAARVDTWLGALEQTGRIVRYVVNGEAFIAIRHWHKHQKIDRAQDSHLPAPPSDTPPPAPLSRADYDAIRDVLGERSTNGQRTIVEGSTADREGEGEGDEEREGDETTASLRSAHAAASAAAAGGATRRQARGSKAAPWMGEIRPIWRERYGGEPSAQTVPALRPLVEAHGIAEVARRFRIFVGATPGRVVDPHRFAATWGEWEQAQPAARASPGGGRLERRTVGEQQREKLAAYRERQQHTNGPQPLAALPAAPGGHDDFDRDV